MKNTHLPLPIHLKPVSLCASPNAILIQPTERWTERQREWVRNKGGRLLWGICTSVSTARQLVKNLSEWVFTLSNISLANRGIWQIVILPSVHGCGQRKFYHVCRFSVTHFPPSATYTYHQLKNFENGTENREVLIKHTKLDHRLKIMQ